MCVCACVHAHNFDYFCYLSIVGDGESVVGGRTTE